MESLTKLSERDQHFDIGVLVLEVLVDHLEPMLNAVLGYGDLLNFFQNSTNLYQVYKPKKIDKVSYMRSLHNLVEEHATQIQAVHSKNKEIQIAL